MAAVVAGVAVIALGAAVGPAGPSARPDTGWLAYAPMSGGFVHFYPDSMFPDHQPPPFSVMQPPALSGPHPSDCIAVPTADSPQGHDCPAGGITTLDPASAIEDCEPRATRDSPVVQQRCSEGITAIDSVDELP